MARIMKLTESDFNRIIKKIINEQDTNEYLINLRVNCLKRTIGEFKMTNEQLSGWCKNMVPPANSGGYTPGMG